MRLSKTTNHAIKILINCARSREELVKVAEISEQLEITQQNVFKIVHLLSRAGFISAVRGRYGGVRLARPAEEIKVGQVVRAIEATATAAQHPVGAGGEEFERMVDSALEAFIEVLDSQTIADMAATAKPAPGKAAKKAKTSRAAKAPASKAQTARPRASTKRSPPRPASA